MNITSPLSKSRGIKNLLLRIISIISRFGISSKRFEHLLNRYSAVTRNLGCIPTFPITAVILKRHPKLIRELCQQGVEFAVHGYIHTDYGVLPLGVQAPHFKKAISIFKEYQVPFIGFRAPFLRTSSATIKALSRSEFDYDSSQAIHWGVIDEVEYTDASWSEYQRLLKFYQSRNARDYLVLPRSTNGFIEIPVSIPDDEALLERLGINNGRKISEIWGSILNTVYHNGELFTLQLHPERILFCEGALACTIQQAKGLNPPVWVATLREIAEWWKERERFTFEINSQGNGRYRAHLDCSGRATVLLKNCKTNVEVNNWFDGYQSINTRDFILESKAYPVVGVARDSSLAAVNFLKSEGYIVEMSDQPGNYGIYLNNLAQFHEVDEKPLSEELDKSNAPLLRYWRWPNQARSALSVTGDIDSITLIDFGFRILENWWQSRRATTT
jgi:hypothetical protein